MKLNAEHLEDARSVVEDTGGISGDPIHQLFTTCVTRLVSVPQRGMGIEVNAYEGQVARLKASKMDRMGAA